MTHPVHTPVVAADGGLVRFALADLLAGAPASMRIDLADAAAAEPWLTRLVGAGPSRKALAAGYVDVPARPELATLAVLLWARRWWPASPALGIPALDPALLDLEAAVATAAVEDVAEGLLDGFEATPAELFDAAAEGLATTSVAGEVRDLCTRLSAWFDGQDDVARAEAAAAAALGATPGQRAYALAAGAGSPAPGAGVVAEGRASVDWARVPPGVLDAAEDTVTWRLVSAPRLEVEVAGAFADAVLTAFATHDGAVFAEVPLRLRAGRFAGAAGLDDTATRLAASAGIAVEVGVTAERVAGTTPADRAEVVALVRARGALPPAARTLAERAAAGSADEEF